jgi:hypothetical protein
LKSLYNEIALASTQAAQNPLGKRVYLNGNTSIFSRSIGIFLRRFWRESLLDTLDQFV